MYKRLLQIEMDSDNSVSLPPGSCTKCEVCSKEYGQACHDQKGLRYSLEALGFLVSDVYKNFFDRELEWVDNGLPTTFDTCSAILSTSKLEKDVIEGHLKGIFLEI